MLTLPEVIAERETYDWWDHKLQLKEDWKFVSTMLGELYVAIHLVLMMHKLLVVPLTKLLETSMV